ncbi:hypothetical protein VIOR3934_10040 [Vibrio orientalis CIP 102891 = ATCC 33934]|uniref:Uncharacterized protein n=1 Tax=Vibrio orientalis CIP 102891 = ATCC 33934 TaxID=675816 RepID=C9QKE3_VIBOR|nr:PmeII family type II restriction endonuclease [Vibrio orientalis]EEX92138.1 hypothetical protein VIA_002782 [Vibrio orientalis CIP 102891 = ATCC 33934]EGU47098.1 hypothetical protein VIOR3934_10040 [Vibrio orientalis CIP 102891 = ATCC 33934]
MLDDISNKKILKLFNELLDGISESAQKLTLKEVLEKSKPLTLELFSNNIEEYFYFITAQRVTKSFSTKLGAVIEKISVILVESQGGTIVKGKPNPFDLKFVHPNGCEYWIEIKSINAQNSSNSQTIKERKELADVAGCIFRLCMYNDDRRSKEEYKLNGAEFWELVGGSKSTGDEVLKLISGLASQVSFNEIVKSRAIELRSQYIKGL